MSDPGSGSSSTSESVTQWMSSSGSGSASTFVGVSKEQFVAAAKSAKNKTKPPEKKHIEIQPFEISGDGFITAPGGHEVFHDGAGSKRFLFTPQSGLLLAKIKGEEVWYFARAGSRQRLVLGDVEIRNGKLCTKDGHRVVPNDASPSLNSGRVYRHKGSPITWKRDGREVYNFRFDGTKIVAELVKGGPQTTLDAQSRSRESLNFGDMFLRDGKAVTSDNEEIFPKGKTYFRGVDTEKPLDLPKKEEKQPAARVKCDPTTGALTYRGKQLSVNGHDIFFSAADGCVMAAGGFLVVDSASNQIARWQNLEVLSDYRLPRASGRALDLDGWTFVFGVRIGITNKYEKAAIDTVVGNLKLAWETVETQQVATRNIGKADGCNAHLSIVQADLRRAVVHGMGVGQTKIQILEVLPYHITVETTGYRNNSNNARYYSEGNTTRGWSKIPTHSKATEEYYALVPVAQDIMGHK